MLKPAQSQTAKRTAKAASGGLPPRVLGAKLKKKKKSKPPDEEAAKKPRKKSKSKAGQSPAMIGGVCVLVLALLIGLPMLFSGDEGPMEPPESYSVFTHHVNSEFKCEYPAGWTVESGGTQGAPVWAKFTSGDVNIRVRSSMGASAIGDIAANLGGMPGEELDEDLAPVAQVHNHEKMKEQFAQEYSEYQESPPEKIETGFGDTRVSEFTASGSWGSKQRGLRASMLGKNLQFTVICDCPEKDWDVCRAIFEKVIKSMSRG